MEFPQGTKDLYSFLGAHHHEGGADHEHSLNVPENGIDPEVAAEKPVIDLPVEDHGDFRAPESIGHLDPAIDHDKKTNTYTIRLSQYMKNFSIKKAWPYIVVFAVAIFFYMVLFTNFSVISFLKSAPKQVQNTVDTKVAKAQYPNIDVYNQWIRSYFFQVNDPKILDPDYDFSGNGLTNYQKFVLGLNPKRTDTMGLGMSDTEALISGINPLTGSPLTENQKAIIADYVNLEVVSNKLALQASYGAQKVAGVNTDERSRDFTEIDTNIPAELTIPSLNLTVPVIWTKDTKDFNTDLQNGVVHYPGTAMPGENGTAYISGHSSNFAWAKGSYNKIFEKLGDLKQYDSFSIKATDVNGKKVTFHYVVTDSQTFKADDQKQFESRNKSVVALSTCWPIGTSSKRLVVFGELSQTDK